MASSSSSSSAAAAASALSRVPVLTSSTSPAAAQLCPNRHGRIPLPPRLKSNSSLSLPKIPFVDGGRDRASFLTKAKLNEIIGEVSNDASTAVSKSGKDAAEQEEPRSPTQEMSPEAIAEFMSHVSNLVKLVDSKDVVELQLKQPGCELLIRKKEALPQPPAPAPVAMMSQVPSPYPVFPPAAPPAAQAAPAAPPTSAPAPAPAPASAPVAEPPPPKSSHPPFKSPMAGTFYRRPAPGEAPYVQVGDKVKKGQILCIIEAMKLMNEIEADYDGTITDIIAEDGKPVGVEQPLMVIVP